MAGSKPSPLSRKLARVREQLKSGKTRGRTPRDLTEAEVKALEDERDRLVDQMRTRRALRSQRLKTQSHVTVETDRAIGEGKRHIDDATASAREFFASIGGSGSSTDLRARAKVLCAIATERAKVERAEKRKAERAAAASSPPKEELSPKCFFADLLKASICDGIRPNFMSEKASAKLFAFCKHLLPQASRIHTGRWKHLSKQASKLFCYDLDDAGWAPQYKFADMAPKDYALRHSGIRGTPLQELVNRIAEDFGV